MPAERFSQEIPSPDLRAFIKEDVDKIRQMGQQLISPFWALSKLGVSYTPQARDLVLAKLSQTTRGNEIHFVETKRGVRFYATNIDALLGAEQEIYTSTIDLFPKKVKKEIDKIFAISKAEYEWQR